MKMVDVEAQRIAALRRFGLLDSPPEEIFDGITAAIANLCEVPIALVSLVDTDRQWFKSAYGIEVTETPRDAAFCAHAITRPDVLMMVEDATVDARFHDNPLVVEDPNIRFYAGKPIVTDDGYALGTLCVIDRRPKRLRPDQIEVLEALSKSVSGILNERLRMQKVAIDRDNSEELSRDYAMKYKQLYQAAESRLSGVLQRWSMATAVVSADGKLVSSNERWSKYSESIGWQNTAIGQSLIEACAHISAPFAGKNFEAIAGLKDVLIGDRDRFKIQYASVHGLCTIDIATLGPSGSGAIVQHYLTGSH